MNRALVTHLSTLLLALGCAHGSPPANAGEPAAWTPTAEESAVYRALSVRDPAPSCATVEALAADPVAVLTSVVEHAPQPPWVGVRAAHCLAVGHAEAAAPTLKSWMTGDKTKGLALMLATEIDQIPEAVAVDLVKAGLAGPHADALRPRLEKATSPVVRAALAP